MILSKQNAGHIFIELKIIFSYYLLLKTMCMLNLKRKAKPVSLQRITADTLIVPAAGKKRRPPRCHIYNQWVTCNTGGRTGGKKHWQETSYKKYLVDSNLCVVILFSCPKTFEVGKEKHPAKSPASLLTQPHHVF